jgi:heme exporter protein B
VLPALVLVLLLGTMGFAAVATLFAFVTVQLRTRQVMLPLLVLPLLMPLLIAAVKATEAVLAGGLASAGEALGVLASFDVIFVTAGALLFPAMLRD